MAKILEILRSLRTTQALLFIIWIFIFDLGLEQHTEFLFYGEHEDTKSRLKSSAARFLQLTAVLEVQSIPLTLLVILLFTLSLRRSVEMTAAHSLTCKQTTNNAQTLIDDWIFFL